MFFTVEFQAHMAERNQENIVSTYGVVVERACAALECLGYSFGQRKNKRDSSKNTSVQSQMNWRRGERWRWKALWTTFISVFQPESSHVYRLHANRGAVFVVCVDCERPHGLVFYVLKVTSCSNNVEFSRC